MEELFFWIFAILTLVFLLVGYGSNSSAQQETKEGSPDERLKQLLDEAEKSPEVETELFLGFKFGMTREQVDGVFADLKNKVMEITSYESLSVCTIKLGDMYIKMTISPDYYNERLYKVNYLFFEGEVNEIRDLFLQSDKYKEGKFNEIVFDMIECQIYHYVKDNMAICFSRSGISGRITYENVPISRKVDRELEEEKKAEKEKLESMF